jgi:hypothetical protein
LDEEKSLVADVNYLKTLSNNVKEFFEKNKADISQEDFVKKHGPSLEQYQKIF